MSSTPRLILAPILGGLAGAAADLVGASVIYGAPFDKIGKAIARGWLGKEGVAAAGDQAIWIGLASHFGIGIGAAVVYLLASRALPVLTRRPIPMGALFGLAVFFFMHLVVVPLSAIGAQNWPPTPQTFVADMASNALFGLLIAYVIARLAPARPKAP